MLSFKYSETPYHKNSQMNIASKIHAGYKKHNWIWIQHLLKVIKHLDNIAH